MNNQEFKGTGVAIVTPFLENGDIDKNGLNNLVEHLINGKVDYLVVLGTTGENATLDKTEKQEVFSLVNQLNKNKRYVKRSKCRKIKSAPINNG